MNVLRPAGSMLRVLFLAATPTDMARIAVGEEYRHIDACVRSSDGAGRFEFQFAHEVRADELGAVLLRHRPHVVHFSGHGSASGELLLPDASGQSAPARPEKLAALFGALEGDLSIRCVVLNACYSEALAKVLAAHVDCVVGVPAALRDKVAVAFSGAFYQAVGFGRDLDAAYRYACAQVDLAVPSRGALPTLHCRDGVRASSLRLLAKGADPPVTPGMSLRPLIAALVLGVGLAVALRWTRAPSRDDAPSTRASPSRDSGPRDPVDASLSVVAPPGPTVAVPSRRPPRREGARPVVVVPSVTVSPTAPTRELRSCDFNDPTCNDVRR